MDIRIKKFKKIDDVAVTLASLNIFIGANNSGKSSFIQGIQFAISGCQTLSLKGGVWGKGIKTLSLDSSEYLYTPTNNIEYLYHGKRLTGSRTKQARSWIEFILSDGKTSTLKISKGKNGGFTTSLSGRDLGEKLSDIEKPYCVYVPGIAGVPTQEKYEVAITVKKSATRGDSNNYLRNILYSISKEAERWSSFKGSVNCIYPNIDVLAKFDEHKSEFIHVFVFDGNLELPLDSVGTGLLQVIQIFAYIEYFNPRVILLDEPDSHIHPTKQKLLAKELSRRANDNPDLRVVFSTHSRYILDALEDKANVVHFQDGTVFQDVKGSKILLDIGAADADYLFSKKALKYIVVTEDKVDDIDEKKDFLRKFLLANGLIEDEFVLHSYEGCTKVDFAKILQGFVRKQIPVVKVIVHIDRDQRVDGDRDLLKLIDDCQKNDLIFFMTKFQEIESYFCTPLHMHEVYGVSLERAEEKYKQFIAELEGETKRKLSNFILRYRKDLSLNRAGQQDIAVVNKLVDEWYGQYGEQLTPGKELLGKVKNFAQVELKEDPNKILTISNALSCEEFRKLLDV
ncbi:ATP-dependent endonuclease [Pseudomonas sp. NFACC45]|uniref:ATP-dependent nuclease n=1 Tax=Pseudomonas sp. NFACC45 TaxID=1566201 RepID=UPI0008F2813B|nr:ATP-binding protein [Pseudomonas sp. NFACC45]SFH33163.1 ATPase/GTPase, AAA15 family [Pseudomonas sp. NFACC45]